MELTKEYFDQQIARLATKDTVDKISQTLGGIQNDVHTLKEDVTYLKQRVDVIEMDVKRIDTKVDAIALRSKQDADALASVYVRLDDRVSVLEQKAKLKI